MKNFLLNLLFLVIILFSTAVSQKAFSREGVTIPTLEINLYARGMDGNMFLADGVLQNFNNSFSSEVDNMDVRKFMNATDNLAIKNGNYNLIVERRPDISAGDTVFLMLTGTRIAPYRFEIDPSVLNYPNINAFLIDKFLRTQTPVSLTAVTSIHFDITTDPLSRAANRFMVVYRKQDPVRFVAVEASRNKDNTINTVFKTENENDVNNYSIERSMDGVVFETIASQMPTANNFGNPYYNYIDARANASYNWYRIKANNITGAAIYSAAVKADEVFKARQSSVNVYPNLITNGKINVAFQNNTFGSYRLTIVGSSGQTVYAETVSVQSALVNKNISIPGIQPGIYRLVTENANGQKKISNLMVK